MKIFIVKLVAEDDWSSLEVAKSLDAAINEYGLGLDFEVMEVAYESAN